MGRTESAAEAESGPGGVGCATRTADGSSE